MGKPAFKPLALGLLLAISQITACNITGNSSVVDCNTLDTSGPRLLKATQTGESGDVAAILDCNGDPNQSVSWQQKGKDQPIETMPLHVAAWQGSGDVVAVLLSAGAKVNGKDAQGSTPLMFAAANNQKSIAQQLINAGADLKAQDKAGQSAYIIAVEAKHQDFAEFIKTAVPIAANTEQATVSPTPSAPPSSPRTPSPAPKPSQTVAVKSSSSSGSQPSISPRKNIYPLGDRVEIQDKYMNISLRFESTRLHEGKPPFLAPKEGTKWFVIKGTLGNQFNTSKTISRGSYSLIDEQGNTYPPNNSIHALEDVEVLSGTLKPGEQKTAEIGFEVPVTANNFSLILDIRNKSACGKEIAKAFFCETVKFKIQ